MKSFDIRETAAAIDAAMESGIPGYEGICRDCFEPVKNGEGYRFYDGGRLFHKKCVEKYPDGLYIRSERRRAQKLQPQPVA